MLRICVPHEAGMEFQLLGVEREPVGIIVAAGKLVPLRLRPVAEPGLEGALRVVDACASRGCGISARHQCFGFVIKLTKELRLPAVPDSRTNRPDIRNGQDQQQAQPFRRLHLLDEILHRLRVGHIALLRCIAHGQMFAHEP
jgi:hypothetical protein